MSTTTSDTEAIDDKKDTTPTTSPFSGTFMATMFSKLLLLGIIVVTGTCMVYTCRVAQSNILPTDLNCYPYTNIMPIINNGQGDISININVVKTNDGIYATQIKFPLNENMESLKFGLFGYLKNMIESKDAGNFQLYAATTIQQLLATNLAIINWIFNLYNSYFTESMIIFIVPFLLIFINFFTGIVNSFYLMFLWFYNLPLLFYEPTRTTAGRKSWTKRNMWSILNWWKSIFWIFIFILLFFILGIGLIIPILAGSITMYSILSPLFMTARKVDNSNKKYTLMDTFMNIIEYKLSVIMYIVSYFVISDAYSSYGSYSALVAIIACLLLYVFTDIYKQYIPETKTPWNSDYKQAAKTGEAVVAIPINYNEQGKIFSNVNGSLDSASPEMINLNNSEQYIPSAPPATDADAADAADAANDVAERGIELTTLANKSTTQVGGSSRIKKRHSRKNVKL